MKKGQTKEKLLRAATMLFAERGYEATTLEMVWREAGASHGSLIHHFRSKPDLAGALLLELIGSYLDPLINLLRSSEADLHGIVAGLYTQQQEWAANNRANVLASLQLLQFGLPGGPAHGKVGEKCKEFATALASWAEHQLSQSLITQMPGEAILGLLLGLPAFLGLVAALPGRERAKESASTQMLQFVEKVLLAPPVMPETSARPARQKARSGQGDLF